MKKALLITVGSGPDVENAIAYSITLHNPNLVVFCCSEKTKATAEKAIELFGGKLAHDNYCIKESAEVNDFENIFDTYCSYISQLEKQGFEADEIVADYTSGTKAMSAALATAAIMCSIHSLCYIYSQKRDDTYGRSLTGDMKPSSLTPNLVYTKRRVDFARKYFNKYQFDTAAALLKKDIHPKYADEAAWLLLCVTAYNAWDKFQFAEANALFKQLINHPRSIDENLTDLFMRHKKLTGELSFQQTLYVNTLADTAKEQQLPGEKRNLLTQQIAVELVQNAKRRAAEGKFDDAAARLYRATEFNAQLLFVKATGYTTTKMPVQKMPDILKNTFLAEAAEGKLSLGLLQTYFALSLLEVEAGKNFMLSKGKWLGVLETRNSSILAHGLTPINEEGYRKFYDMVIALLAGCDTTEWPGL